MISKILLRKCGFGKSKAFSNDAHDSSSSSNTEVEHGPQENSNSHSDKNRSSSKFYVGVEDNVAISGDLSLENSQQLADEGNVSVECVVSECMLVNNACKDSDLSGASEKMDKNQVDSYLSRVLDKMNNSQVASIKPEVKPKPKVPSSPPVKLLPCVRASIFPPVQDICDRNEGKPKSSLVSLLRILTSDF